MKENYFFEYLLANPEIFDKSIENAANFCKEMVMEGKTDTYAALTKDHTVYNSLTFQNLADFAKDIYAIRYQQIVRDDPQSAILSNKSWAPDKISADDCFNMFFTQKAMTQWGFSEQNEEFDAINNSNRNTTLPSDFVHFAPNGYPDKTHDDVDPRSITKRIYFNVSPTNALNITKELAQYAADTGAKIYCKFHTDSRRSDPLLFYTNEEQLPELMYFLDQLEQKHPEYLEPADCKQPFTAPVRPYCGIADEPVQSRTSFNSQMSKALDEPIKTMEKLLFEEAELNKMRFAVGKDGKVVDAEGYASYMTWLKVGQSIKQMQENFSSAQNDYEKEAQAYANELWAQYVDARSNPKSFMANEIQNASQELYESMLSGNPSRKLSITTKTNHENPWGQNKKWHPEMFERDKQQTGKVVEKLPVQFNLYKELIKTLNLEDSINSYFTNDGFVYIFGDSMDKNLCCASAPFLNKETYIKMADYMTARENGEIEYKNAQNPAISDSAVSQNSAVAAENASAQERQ